MEAQAELYDLQNEANDLTLSQRNDEWTFPWGNKFSTRKLYRALIGDHIIPSPILDIWKTCIFFERKCGRGSPYSDFGFLKIRTQFASMET
jgi:hypothetical protein